MLISLPPIAISFVGLTLLTAIAGAARADGMRFELGGLTAGFSGVVTSGVAIRTQARSNKLIGKLNVPGQQNLCTLDDCMSQSSAEPNARLVAAQGAYGGVNFDDGNLNYDRYDIYSAPIRLAPELVLDFGEWHGKFSGIVFYDPVNAHFDETHPNTRFQPAKTARHHDIARELGWGGKLRDAYVSRAFELFDRDFSLTVGNQRIQWGESILTPLNTLNSIMPVDAVLARMPGFQLSDLFQPVPAVSLGSEFFEGLSADVFYQFHRRVVVPDPVGSFFSTNDVISGGRDFVIGLGQFAEDPDNRFRAAGVTGLSSSSSRTVKVIEDYGHASNGGQYGLELKLVADTVLGATEFGAYYANYHSRLPYLSAISADASCTRASPVQGNFAAAFATCRGFNGSVNPVGGLEPLPVDTLQLITEYPENIRMFGFTFNGNLGSWAIAGEYAYRPNLPLQVHVTDVLYAGLAPAFPEQDIPVPAGATGLALNAPFTIPGHRRIAPDFLSRYRGLSEYGPNTRIDGYERFKVGQFALTGVRIFGGSANPFGADQIILLTEVSGTQIFNRPALSELQLEGTGNRSHYSAGADGTGSPNGKPDFLRINPTQQKVGAATSFSWGYRVLIRGQYSNALAGINLTPSILFFHDLGGISPVTIDNYVAGRKTINVALDAELTRSLVGGTQYQWHTGGGRNNLRSDRDNLSLFFRYSF